MKTCTNPTCKSSDPLAFYKNKSNKDGLTSWCKQCLLMKEKHNSQEMKDRKRDQLFLKTYGIPYAQKEAMLKAQQDKCAVCAETFRNKKDIHLDHNHDTKRVRQLLCSNCNTALGLIKENLKIALSLVNYIRSHSDQ